MKAIMVVFFRTRKPETSKQQVRLRPTGTLAAPANPNSATWTPPFWTWFIDNPRLVKGNRIGV